MTLPHIAGIAEPIVAELQNSCGACGTDLSQPELILHDGSRGYLDLNMVTDDGAVPFVYTWIPDDDNPPPPLFLPLVGCRLFEDTP